MITRMRKLLIGGSLALAAGMAIYGTRQASLTRSDLWLRNEEARQLDTQIERLVRQQSEMAGLLAAQEEENQRLSSHQASLLKQREEAAPPTAIAQDQADTASEIHTWAARVSQLKQCLELNSAARIPEFELLDEGDWLSVAMNFPMQTEFDYRLALSSIRSRAEQKFMSQINKALQGFKRAHGKRVPANLEMLGPYFKPPADSAMLARWTIVPGDWVPAYSSGSDFVITQMSALVDPEFDTVTFVTTYGNGVGSLDAVESDRVLEPVYKAYQVAHKLESLPIHLDPKTLLPFAVTPEQKAMLQKVRRIHAAPEGK
jgi:hypothetical protein